MKKSLVVSIAAAMLAAAPATAQGMQAELRKDVTYYQVVFVKFKNGKRDRAFEIIEKYFKVADAGATEPVIEIHTTTGPWDTIAMMPMRGGVADLGYVVAPDDARWFAALSKLVGGDAKAQAIMDEYDSLIERSQTEIGHRHSK